MLFSQCLRQNLEYSGKETSHVDGRIVEKSWKIYCFMPLCLSVLSSKPNCAQNLWFPLGPLQWKCLPKRLTEDIQLSQLGVSDPKLCLSQDPRLHRKSPISKVDKSQVSGEFWRRENSTLKKGISSLNANQDAKGTPLGGSCLQIATLQSLQLRSSNKILSALWILHMCRNYEQNWTNTYINIVFTGFTTKSLILQTSRRCLGKWNHDLHSF